MLKNRKKKVISLDRFCSPDEQEIDIKKEHDTKKEAVEDRNNNQSLDIIVKPQKKQKICGRNMEGGSSKLHYNPSSKDFDTELKILKEPSDLFTMGKFEDFYDLLKSKFEQLSTLMRKNNGKGFSKIGDICNLKERTEVQIIGLIDNLRSTRNNHVLFSLEDMSGKVKVLVNKHSSMFPYARTLINDILIAVRGTFTSSERNGGIIFADDFCNIDIPLDNTTQKSEQPISVGYLSDLHVGSKEFKENLFLKFLKFINGKSENPRLRKCASKIKYLIINGDLVDGVGIYPDQETDQNIPDIYRQYEKCYELLLQIPDHITVIYTPGNHEPVRNALPRSRIPKKYLGNLVDLNLINVGNPSFIEISSVKHLLYHGDSIIDINMQIAHSKNSDSINAMRNFLKFRHMAPIYGSKTQIAPLSKDWMVIDQIPDIFHTGHTHINAFNHYNDIRLINSGCFQSQTSFMRSFGIEPTPGIIDIISLDSLQGFTLDCKSSIFQTKDNVLSPFSRAY